MNEHANILNMGGLGLVLYYGLVHVHVHVHVQVNEPSHSTNFSPSLYLTMTTDDIATQT